MFCKHKWELVTETATKSKFEHATEVANKSYQGRVKLPDSMCCTNRKFIQVFACPKCGRLKKLVENI